MQDVVQLRTPGKLVWQRSASCSCQVLPVQYILCWPKGHEHGIEFLMGDLLKPFLLSRSYCRMVWWLCE